MTRTTKILVAGGAALGVAAVSYGIYRLVRRPEQRQRNPRRLQWSRIDHAQAPLGHALTVRINGTTWVTYELEDGRWQLEPSSGRPLVVGSLQEARDYAEGK